MLGAEGEPLAVARATYATNLRCMESLTELDLRDTYADLESCRIHYVSRGEGRPILFLHGFPQLWFLWRRQLADLGEDHAVYAPDMRGYNLSSHPAEVDAYRMRHLSPTSAGCRAAPCRIDRHGSHLALVGWR